MPSVFLALLLLFQEDVVPTFRTEVSVVRADVRVTGPDGRDISGLTAKDFVVYDEGERREILDFDSESKSERKPLDLLLILDVSGSMWQHLRELSTTTTKALSQLDKEDRVGLVLFATRSRVAEPLSTEHVRIERAITENIFKQTLGRDTNLNPALKDAVAQFRPGARHAALVVTDGGTEAPDPALLKAVQGSDAVVSGIVVGGGSAPALAEYTKLTGGNLVASNRVSDALTKSVAEIRTRYALSYAAPASQGGKYRRIKVELTPEARKRFPAARIVAREGYYAK